MEVIWLNWEKGWANERRGDGQGGKRGRSRPEEDCFQLRDSVRMMEETRRERLSKDSLVNSPTLRPQEQTVEKRNSIALEKKNYNKTTVN